MSINRETWMVAREEYIRGRGSLATVAARHGLKRGSVEKRSRKEGWTRLRREFEAAQLAKLIPPPLLKLPPLPVALDGSVTDEWMRQRQSFYYRENAGLLDKVRRLLDARLTSGADLDEDGLARLTTALGGIVTAEALLLGLRDRRSKKSERAYRFSPPMPVAFEPPDPQPV
jgi:hypothetical protein